MCAVGALPFYLRASAAYGFCFATMTTLSLVYMVEVAHLDPLQMVLVGTVLEASVFCFEIPTGVVADVVSRRLSVIIGHVLIGAGFLILSMFPTFAMILVSQVVWGVGWTFVSGAYPAWLSEEIGVGAANAAFARAAQYGQVGAFCGIGAAVGFGHFGLWLPIAVGAFGVLGIAAAMMQWMPETNFRPAAAESRATFRDMATTFATGVREVRARPLLVTIFTITVAYGAFTEGFDRLWIPHVIASFEFPAAGRLDTVVWWGAIAAVASAASVVVTSLARSLVDVDNHRQLTGWLAVSTVAIGVVAIGFANASAFWLGLGCYWLLVALRAARGPFQTAWLNRELPASARATLLSMNGQADAIGQTVGGPLFGVIAKQVAIPVALTVSALVLVPTLWLYRKAAGLGANATAK